MAAVGGQKVNGLLFVASMYHSILGPLFPTCVIDSSVALRFKERKKGLLKREKKGLFEIQRESSRLEMSVLRYFNIKTAVKCNSA